MMTRPGTNTVEQRSVILIPFPFSDLSSYRVRPALVLSNTDFNSRNDDVICCMITTEPTSHPHTVHITASDMERGNISRESKIKPYRIFSVSKNKILKILGKLNLSKSLQVQKEIFSVISLQNN